MRMLAGFLALAGATSASAQLAPSSDDPKTYPLLQIGEIMPRPTTMPAPQGARGLSIGLETIERDYVSYAAVEPYLVPLGFRQARLMAGWSNIEKTKGVYDFSEIKAIVRDLRAKGIQPWVGLTYGNPDVYQDRSGATLGGHPPVTPESRAAWLRFVRALVTELGRDGVTEWEIWNEPNYSIPAEVYAPFAVQTANAVLAAQPGATLDLGAFLIPTTAPGDKGMPYVEATLKAFKAGVKVPPAQVKVSYHPYTVNPDSWYDARFDAFRKLVDSYGYGLRNGENGAPSASQQVLALRNADWTEDGQAKYALRRVIGDLALGIETGYFTMADIHYPTNAGSYSKNMKGLLQTGRYTGIAPDYGDKRVVRTKVAYRAMQNVASVFDDSVRADPAAGCTVPEGYRAVAFVRPGANGAAPLRAVAVWRAADRPGDFAKAVPVRLRCDRLPLGIPDAAGMPAKLELANLLTSSVYRVVTPIALARREGAAFVWPELPVTDSPVLIADAGFVRHE